MSKELFKRRVQIRTDELIRHGREQIPRRSDFLEWNYDSELYAFSVRLGENFDDSKIREAFVDQSHVEMEAERHRALEMGSEDEFAITSNDRLAEVGSTFLSETLESYVRVAFPFWPEEGVQALVAFLNSNEVQAEISFHIGTRDLIFAKDYPPDMPTYAKVFRALVGVLVESGHEDQAKRFIYDLVVPQLHVQDINEIWDIKDPMRLLMTILKNEGKSEPESRLLWVSGLDTIMACYHVGIYVDKELIGQGPGESAEIAEEMATRDALRRMFRSDESMPMIPMGDYLDPNQIKAGPKANLSASEWSQEKVLKNLQTI
ncbi:hypothetical protein TCAL_01170 [Tigriopus californicus]|uniref:Large ribosomal subunit protein mL44 n=2 Tax=Tigriopus californicus TaxID=6832 RepID=A0A553P064_TIGCA|nr:hypothetical protein TCAL_01170 [Tigriopus californicus]|eukprot:TCALIF_01170-PA protein Name:"Similar to MRPL44 39S ribosomal protein L44, mitochondrial (Bos taurus)" AED:0.08 eAED:0.08 QI:86/1/1/1/1/1/4/108/317